MFRQSGYRRFRLAIEGLWLQSGRQYILGVLWYSLSYVLHEVFVIIRRPTVFMRKCRGPRNMC